MSDNVKKILQQCQNVESLLFTTDYAHFQNFSQMQNFLECADSVLSTKIDELDKQIQQSKQSYIRRSTVYEYNNKKRAKQEQLLNIQRQKIMAQLQAHKKRLQIQIHPATLVLKEKKKEIQKLNQTKEIIEDFNKILKGDEQQLKKIMPLDQKNLNNSALKIYIFKALIDDLDVVGNISKQKEQIYDLAKNQIRKKFAQLKNKIIVNFKEGFWKKDIIIINNTLPYCQQYDLMNEISEFYNQQAFKECHKIIKFQQSLTQNEIKNFFFLLERGFNYAFNEKELDTGLKNPVQIYQVFGKFSDVISRKLITFVFQKLIKESLQNVLKSTFNSSIYLTYLQVFYTQCKNMQKKIQKMMQDQRIIHLMTTYFQSIFDSYLEGYLTKQLNYQSTSIQEQIQEIMQEIKTSNAYQQNFQQAGTQKKFSLKKLMDYKIQEKTYNYQATRLKLKTLTNIFMNSSLQKIFMIVKTSLNRNMKISKMNEVDKNRTQILTIFINNMGQLIENLINSIGEVVPGFDQKNACLQPDFFLIIPNINLFLQRIQLIYLQNKKEAKYQFAEALKLQQKKQALILRCEKKLNKIVSLAEGNILINQNAILKSSQNEYFITNEKQKIRNQTETTCSKVIAFLQKYLKPINRISLNNYKKTILKDLGTQFVKLLIQHYSQIPYTKDGLGNIFIDIANYKKIVIQIDSQQVDQKYKVLRSLIDIYVIKNQEKTISSYIKSEIEAGVLNQQKEETIKDYVQNKTRYQKC